MEARLHVLGALCIVLAQETRPNFTPPLDAGERCDLREFDSWVDLAAGEIWMGMCGEGAADASAGDSRQS